MRAPPPQTAQYTPAPSECDATAVCIAPGSPAGTKRAVASVARGGARQRALALACFAAVALLTCSYSLLLQLAKGADGKFAFSPLSVTFVAEASKLAISTALVYVPAALYLLQNNLVYTAMPHLTPPLYQLLSNLKIVATAVLTRVILRRLLTRLQWLGVALLALASALPGLAAFTADGDAAAGLTRADFVTGTAIMSGVAFLSGLAGVLTERLLKSAPGSTHFKNMQLYAAGVLLYLPPLYASLYARHASSLAADAHMMTQSGSTALALARGLFAGWTPLTWLLVVNLAVQGLCISFLLTFASNIEKLFAGAAALFASIALSVPLFGLAPRPADAAGGALVCVALVAYHWRELSGGGGA